MNGASSQGWTQLERESANGSGHTPKAQRSWQAYSGHSNIQAADNFRFSADGGVEVFSSQPSVEGGEQCPASRRQWTPAESRTQAASKLLAADDLSLSHSSALGGPKGSPIRRLPTRRHTLPASMLPPLVVPLNVPTLQLGNSSRRGELGDPSSGLSSPVQSKANGHLTSPSNMVANLALSHGRANVKLNGDFSLKLADISTTPSPVTVGKGPTGMQPSPMSPGSTPTTTRSVPSPDHAQNQIFSSGYQGSFMRSPDYSREAGDLHYPSPLPLNRSLPNPGPGGLSRAQSMPLQFVKVVGGSKKQDLDPQGRVQELCSAARAGDHTMVQALLRGARSQDQIYDAVNEATGKTALHEAVSGGQYDMVVHLLMDWGADPDAKLAVSAGPPLLHAVQMNNEKMVEILLTAGAAVDARNMSDCTALHVAASLGHRKILKQLLTHGANPMIRNRDGRTPIDCAANERTQKSFEKYLAQNPNFDMSEQSDVTPGSVVRGGESAWEGYSDHEQRGRGVMSPPRGVISPPASHPNRAHWRPPHNAYDAGPRISVAPKSKSFTQSTNPGAAHNYSTSAPSHAHSASVLSPPNSYYTNGGFDPRWKPQQEEPPPEENLHHSFESASSADTVHERPDESFLEEAVEKAKEGKVVGVNPSEAERMAHEARGVHAPPPERKPQRPLVDLPSNRGRPRSVSDNRQGFPDQDPSPSRQYHQLPWSQIPLLRTLSGGYPQRSISPDSGGEFGSQNRLLPRTVSDIARHEVGTLSRTLGTPGYHHPPMEGGRSLSQSSYSGRDPWGRDHHENWPQSREPRRANDYRGGGAESGHPLSEGGRPPVRSKQNLGNNFFDGTSRGEGSKSVDRHVSQEGLDFSAREPRQLRGQSDSGFGMASQSSSRGRCNSAFRSVVEDQGDWQSGRGARRSMGPHRQAEWGVEGPMENGGHAHLRFLDERPEGPSHAHRRSFDEMGDLGGGGGHRHRRSLDEKAIGDWSGRTTPGVGSAHRHVFGPSGDIGRLSDTYWETGSRGLEPSKVRNPMSGLENKAPSSLGLSTPASPRARVYLTAKTLTNSNVRVLLTSPPKRPVPTPPQTPGNPSGSGKPTVGFDKPDLRPASPILTPEATPTSAVKLTSALKKGQSTSSEGSRTSTDSAGPAETKTGGPTKKVNFDTKDLDLINQAWRDEAEKNGCVACGKTECDGSCNPANRPAVIPPSATGLFGEAETKQTGSFVWTRGELLGEGAYGKVFAGLNQETGQLMAVKQLKLNDSDQSREYQRHVAALEREISLYRKMRHKHIVGYINMERDDASGSLYVFLEYVSGGSIHSMLERFGRFSEPLVRVYTRQLLQGLEYLHECKIIHRDIKGGNVLVDRDGVIKLADFGASKAFHDATVTDACKSIRGSVFWMAPEVIKGEGYGRRADIWSVGCTVIEMLTGSHPWPGIDNTWTAIFHIAKALSGPPVPEIASPLAREFLTLCFALDPKERPTATQLLSHPFVAQAGEVAQAPPAQGQT